MLPAALMPASPPIGLGCYVRDRIEEGVPWAFLFVNAWRADRAEQIAQARELGAKVGLYGTPERFQPATWRAGVDRLANEAARLGVEHVLADPETVWPELSSGQRENEARALGTKLVEVSRSFRVGVTSYPRWPGRQALASVAAGHVWASPQIYGRSAMDAAVFAEWLELWTSLFGATAVAPSIAGWAASSSMRTPQGFANYLAMLPRTAGQIVWDEAGSMPRYIREALAAHEPGGTRAESAALALRQVVSSRPVMLAAAIVTVLLLAVALSRSVKG